jgi:hypothetical protein
LNCIARAQVRARNRAEQVCTRKDREYSPGKGVLVHLTLSRSKQLSMMDLVRNSRSLARNKVFPRRLGYWLKRYLPCALEVGGGEVCEVGDVTGLARGSVAMFCDARRTGVWA